MFWNKKTNADDKLRANEIFSNISKQREAFSVTVGQMEKRRVRMFSDVSQLLENTKEQGKFAEASVEEEIFALFVLDNLSQELNGVSEEYQRLKTLLVEQIEKTFALVEENKCYTTASRSLKDVPAALKYHVYSYEKQLEEIVKSEKQVSILAQNMEKEAESFGEDGKRLMEITEELKHFATACEIQTHTLQKEVHRESEEINELEEMIQQLVALLKDNTIAATHLLKKGQELKKQVGNSTVYDFSEEFAVLRDKIVGMRNMDEEIVRSGERNRILISDIQDDMQMQKNALTELVYDLAQMMDTAEGQ